MIETDNTFGNTTITCEEVGCDVEFEVETEDWSQATREAKDTGWTIVKKGNFWEHYCPEHKPN